MNCIIIYHLTIPKQENHIMQRIMAYCQQQLGDIVKKCQEIEAINKLLLEFLPKEFHQYCRVASFNQGCLVLVTPDASWASQLRFLLPELRDNLRTHGKLFQLSSIKIKIADN